MVEFNTTNFNFAIKIENLKVVVIIKGEIKKTIK